MTRLVFMLLVVTAGCGGSGPDPDGDTNLSSPDAGTVPMDGGASLDSGPRDVDPPAIDGGSSPSPDGGVGSDSGVSRDSGAPATDTGGGASNLELLFQSSFAGDTAIEEVAATHDRLTGADQTVPQPNDWQRDFVTNNAYWGSSRIDYEDDEGDRIKRYADIHPDGFLRFVLRDAHIAVPNPQRPAAGTQRKGRIQLAVNQIQGLDAFTYRVKLKLTGGFVNLAESRSTIDWMTLAEIWNDASDSDTSARFHVAINKDRQEGFVWKVTGQEKVRTASGFDWVDIPGFAFPPDNQLRRGYLVGLNEWFELTITARDGLEDGRMKVTVGRPGERPETIADWQGPTRHDRAPADGFDAIQFMKLYTNGLLLDAMAQEVPRPPALEIHWDDFKVWAGADF